MRNVRGLTMIELMIVLSIASVAIAMASPSFSRMIAQQQVNSLRDTLVAALRFTKLQAIYLNKPISICPSANKISCDFTNQWNNGFIAFIDENPIGWGSGDTVLRQWNGKETLAIKNITSAPALIRFTARGIVSDGGGSDIEFCHPQGKAAQKSVHLSATIGTPSATSRDQMGCS